MQEEQNIEVIRHSLDHVMMQALRHLYDAIPGVGPSIENGFYHDFDAEHQVTEAELRKIEKEMKKIIRQNLPIERKVMSIDEGIKFLEEKGYKYTLELAEDLKTKGETEISFYEQGDFMNMCKGPHVESTGKLNPEAFKLTKLAGAYWRGSEKNKMLQRIYGVAFENKEELEKHLEMLKEAEKRDHRKLGKELDLFVFSNLVGPGLPLYTFKGATIRREIINYSNELQKAIGYQEVHTPNINKAELFKVSGHYEKYKEDMLKVVSNYTEEEYFLKPMNCPHHTQIYASKMRSYKELPLRIADFANLYRDEKPGELSGLTRLRCFCQDDGHSFCREDQIKDEFVSVLGVIKKAMKTYNMNYIIRLSLWDKNCQEKYLGDAVIWEKSQKLLEEILIENKIDYFRAEGEAAIYGPKMDLISRDSLGREWQISTIQLDFIMPQRFGLKYVDHNGMDQTPVMIHRAIVGSPERFLGILIEHYAGNFPVWLSPVQVKVISVGESHIEFCHKLANDFIKEGIRVEVDDSNETVGKKIKKATNEKAPYLLVVGDREMNSDNLSVRNRGTRESREINKKDFIEEIKESIKFRKA